eukprot:5061503-Pleurochrysis_carterae.AAC.1
MRVQAHATGARANGNAGVREAHAARTHERAGKRGSLKHDSGNCNSDKMGPSAQCPSCPSRRART